MNRMNMVGREIYHENWIDEQHGLRPCAQPVFL